MNFSLEKTNKSHLIKEIAKRIHVNLTGLPQFAYYKALNSGLWTWKISNFQPLVLLHLSLNYSQLKQNNDIRSQTHEYMIDVGKKSADSI